MTSQLPINPRLIARIPLRRHGVHTDRPGGNGVEQAIARHRRVRTGESNVVAPGYAPELRYHAVAVEDGRVPVGLIARGGFLISRTANLFSPSPV